MTKYKEWKLSVCHENYPCEEVDDTRDFEASRVGITIEWK